LQQTDKDGDDTDARDQSGAWAADLIHAAKDFNPKSAKESSYHAPQQIAKKIKHGNRQFLRLCER
jgi:hypothetical protein